MSMPSTIGVKDSSRNVTAFIKDNKAEFNNLLNAAFPYLFVAVILFVGLTYMSMQDMFSKIEALDAANFKEPPSSLNNPIYIWAGHGLSLFIAYILACIAVSWHRLCLLPHDQYRPMHFLKPEKHEIEFVLMWTLIGVLTPAVFGLLMQNLIIGGGTMFAMILGLAYVIIFPYILYKLSFYFPAKAIDRSITLGQSFQLTKGYFWKIGASFFLAVLVPILLCIGYLVLVSFVVMPIVLTVLINTDGGVNGGAVTGMLVSQGLIYAGFIWYFQPLFTIIGVSVISNYFQHALQNNVPVENND